MERRGGTSGEVVLGWGSIVQGRRPGKGSCAPRCVDCAEAAGRGGQELKEEHDS